MPGGKFSKSNHSIISAISLGNSVAWNKQVLLYRDLRIERISMINTKPAIHQTLIRSLQHVQSLWQ
jgi:hypothetical protein